MKPQGLAVSDTSGWERRTGSYTRLVNLLKEQNLLEEAKHWAAKGMEKLRDTQPGTASQLSDALRDIARKEGNWKLVTAHAAHEFLEYPSVKGLNELIEAAEKAQCDDAVRRSAMKFLETGINPVQLLKGADGRQRAKVSPDWPLPVPEYLVQISRRQTPSSPQPWYEVLIDAAIAQNNPDEVLRWYDEFSAANTKHATHWGWGGWTATTADVADRVAAAVASSYPESSVEIYRKKIDANLTHADPHAYSVVAEYLKKAKPIMKSIGQAGEYRQVLDHIRQRYRNRPKLMAILREFEPEPIVVKRIGPK
jgi:uncharacterized Zn finger protein